MPAKIFSCSIFGFDCRLVEVEVDILNGPASITIVGLGDAAVQESKERIRSAIKNSGAEYPRRKKTINLAPADLHKHGPMFDLPIALGLLLQSKQIPEDSLNGVIAVGELALSGHLRKIPGALPIAAYAAKRGFHSIIIPAQNVAEASVVEGIKIIPAENLTILLAHLQGETKIEPAEVTRGERTPSEQKLWTLEEIRGHENAKRALAIAAAGGHNMLFYGPPGSGKTMLARSFQSILPPLSFDDAVEVTKIYSIAGKLPSGQSLIHMPPFRAVHHTASAISLVGGGALPRPGEISLAHKGVLFLDELLEFPRAALDVLRQPMEDGTVSVTRAAGSAIFPAQFTLIAATNPCMCGYLGDPVTPCMCKPAQLQQYRKKLSGPLLDRIDIVCSVPRLPFDKITRFIGSETSEIVRKKVMNARQIQYERMKHFAEKNPEKDNTPDHQNETDFANALTTTNSRLSSAQVRQMCNLNPKATNLLKRTFSELNYSGRSYYRILKVARTIADMEHSREIQTHHLAEAIQYRPRIHQHGQ